VAIGEFSKTQLDLLRVLNPNETVTPAAASALLRVGPHEAANVLDQLTARGVLRRDGNDYRIPQPVNAQAAVLA
jgi:DNA-binding IclR family transcriptional regulator